MVHNNMGLIDTVSLLTAFDSVAIIFVGSKSVVNLSTKLIKEQLINH